MSDGCDTLLDKTDAAKADNYFVVTYNTDDKGVLKSTAITESNFGSDNFDRCLENVMKSYGYVAPAVEPNGEVKERLEYTSTRVVKTDSLAH